MTLIVVEGIDGSGKSTLIANLVHHMPDNVGIMRRGPINRHPMEEYEYDLSGYAGLYDDTHHLLLDRWHIGEMIYGPLYRGTSQLTPAMKLHVDLLLQKFGALKLLMDTPLDVVKQRLASRPGGEKFLKPEHMQLVYDAYHELCPATDWWHLSPKTSSRDIDFTSIIRAAEAMTQKAAVVEEFNSYIGPPDPSLLILGDKRAQQRQGRPNYQWAFVPYRDTSGHFLFTALDSVNLRNFGVANAAEENVTELWETLNYPHICVLGQNALSAVSNRGLNNWVKAYVAHPQYVKRFNTMTPHEYGREIKKAQRG